MKTLWQEYSGVVYSCFIKVPKESNPVSILSCHSFLSHGPYLTQPVARPHEANLCPALVRKPKALYVSSIYASFYPRAPWKLDREKSWCFKRFVRALIPQFVLYKISVYSARLRIASRDFKEVRLLLQRKCQLKIKLSGFLLFCRAFAIISWWSRCTTGANCLWTWLMVFV